MLPMVSPPTLLLRLASIEALSACLGCRMCFVLFCFASLWLVSLLFFGTELHLLWLVPLCSGGTARELPIRLSCPDLGAPAPCEEVEFTGWEVCVLPASSVARSRSRLRLSSMRPDGFRDRGVPPRQAFFRFK